MEQTDALSLVRWASRAAAELGRRADDINRLNVFPVADSDTGSNMAFTMQAAVDEAVGEKDPVEQSRALASGAVRGARGNSGVILSQLVRAFVDEAEGGLIDAPSLITAFYRADEYVFESISNPVEGTAVTVLNQAAHTAEGKTVVEILSSVVMAAQIALEKTTDQLDVLKEAGVVDAGATGLVIVLEAALAEARGDVQVEGHVKQTSHGSPGRIEVMFMTGTSDLTELKAQLSVLGDSLVVAQGDGEAHVHIHSREAGKVIETAYATGPVWDLRLEVLPDVDKHGRILAAVTPPGAIAELYRSQGATVVTLDNDDPEVALKEATSQFAEPIVLRQGLLAGLAALSVYDPEMPLETAIEEMGAAQAAMRVVQVRRVGFDFVVEEGGAEFVAESTLRDAVIAAVPMIADARAEQVTVLATEGLGLAEDDLKLQVIEIVTESLCEPDIVAEIGVE